MAAKFTLLNTRPAHQAGTLTAEVNRIGGQATESPTLAIQWVEENELCGCPIPQADVFIFISCNAVKGVFRNPTTDVNAFKGKTLFAIGQATAQCLAGYGLQVREIDTPSQYDSEALIDYLHAPNQIDWIRQSKICLVKGRAGRETLKLHLDRTAKQVTEWVVYERVSVSIEKKIWLAFKQQPYPVILATSQASLESLVKGVSLLGEAEVRWLTQQTLIVFSNRIKQFAMKFPWQGDIKTVHIQSNEGVLKVLKHLTNIE